MNAIHDPMEKWDEIRDAEDMVRELTPDVVTNLEQWAKKTLHTENNLSRFVQLMKGCWQDIWDIENKRNDWIFDEFTRYLFIKLNEDSKPNGSFTSAKFTSYCEQNKHMGDKAGQNFINNLFDDLKGRHPEVFTDDNEKVLGKSITVERVIKRLEDINLKDTQGDVLGRAFEIMLSDTFKGKDLGQFFTPREIVAFMLDLVRETPESAVLNLEQGERFLDACAGSGGFLIAAYEDVYKHVFSQELDPSKKKRLLKRLGQDTFFAAEIEEKAARLGKLNMIIHAVDQENANWLHQNYIYNDEYGGLKPEVEYEVNFGSGKRKKQVGQNSIDLILTNPPFGKSVKINSILMDYQFGHIIKVFKTKGRPPEKRAKNSQDRSNATAKPVRDYIRENSIIKAVISLPKETFASTGTSIPTNVVYLQKKRQGDMQGDIFMARADYVGRRANGDPLKENDLPFILEKFREWQAGTLQLPEEEK